MAQINKLNIEILKGQYRSMWWEMSTILKIPFKVTNYFKKKNNEKKFEFLLDEIVEVINSFPEEEMERVDWKNNGQQRLERILNGIDGFELGKIDKEMKVQFINTTKEFISECKKFDSDISYGEIGQAMRNLWIISILQKAFGKDIRFNMASFGYSMLYPYSDNYLDNQDIALEEKVVFNERFYKRLIGDNIKPNSEQERKIFQLIEKIEEVYDRSEFIGVYESLLAIFEGQRKSLIQQEGRSNPYERDMLDISMEKGGASVLADGYIIDGNLNKEEEIFTFGYGFLLQLCDDLQDVKEDLKNNHMTVMSQLAGKYDLDNIVTKLINLTINIVIDAKCFKGENIDLIKKLIIDNCILMIMFAAAMSREYFSKAYIKEVEKYLPFTLNYIDKIKGPLQSKLSLIERNYYGVEIEEVLFYLVN